MELILILIQDILYCEADSNYTYIHLKNGQKLLNARTLKEYDQMLSELDFCRIHQTYLINLNHLEKYFRGDGGYVKMTNGVSLNVSRAKKEELLSKMNMQ
ncbi:MAG: LytTR family DNA-binding domain-containing protein [Saprospiraceae bacterium]